MSFYRSIRSSIGKEIKSRPLHRIYRKFSDYTMIPESVYVDNLILAQRVVGHSGCVVECGVWRGGMCAGIASIMGLNRQYFLFDSYEGLPLAKEIDGQAATAWQQDKDSSNFYDNCKAEEGFADTAMSLSGAKSYSLVKGWFSETMENFVPPEPISLLRLDADWYDSTMTCLESLYQHVMPGGLIILDDYYTWDGCSRALHDFLSRRSATERIRSFGEICYIFKGVETRETQAS